MSLFSGKRALIYGGANGIGAAVAEEFARRGAAVAIADIDTDSTRQTAQGIVDAGKEAVDLECDVTSDVSVREAAVGAERALGEMDIVMNNVGGILSGNPEEIPIAEWQRILDLNLMPAVRSNDVFLPKMIERGSGHIVNTASFAGLYPYAANRMPYVASKAAVVALSESLALYLIPRGVRVSCFCPGPVMTNVMAGMKTWSANAAMRGPGTQFMPITAAESARILADGMEHERILIPTHEGVWQLLRDHAASPDRFIHDKIGEFARGESGLPGRK